MKINPETPPFGFFQLWTQGHPPLLSIPPQQNKTKQNTPHFPLKSKKKSV